MAEHANPDLSPRVRARVSGARMTSEERPRCGATRHRDGQPCQAPCEPGKQRCRFHGGRSTGPRTEAGKARALANLRSEEHTSELQSLMRIPYAVFCLKKKKNHYTV